MLQPSSISQNRTDEWEPLIDPDQPLPSVSPFGIDTAIGDSLSLFGSNFWLITKIVVVTVVPFEIFRAFNLVQISNQWELSAWSVFLSGVCKVLVAPALIYALMKIMLTGEAPSVHESYRWGLTKFAKLGICTLIFSVLQALGYGLLIIPGIIVSLVFILVYPIAVLENGSVSETFARSIELTRGHRPQIFVVWIILGVLLMISSTIGSFVADGAMFWLVTAIIAVARDILDQALTVLSLVMYLSLPRRSGSDTGSYTVLSLSK